MTLPDFQVTLETKVKGTLNLRKAFEGRNPKFFLMLSSAADILGTSGQGNYNAGNAVQDAIAQTAESHGCHYIAFNPGMIEGTSAIQNNETRISALHRSGLISINTKQLDEIIDYLLSPTAREDHLKQLVVGFDSRSLTHAVSANGNIRSAMFSHTLRETESEASQEAQPSEKSLVDVLKRGNQQDLLMYITKSVGKKIASLVSIDEDALDFDKPIYDFGLDSLIAIELRNWIKREFEATLQSLEILDEQSIRSLSEKI